MTSRTRSGPRIVRRILFAIGMLVIALLAIEGTMSLVRAIRNPQTEESWERSEAAWCAHDPDLGWVNRGPVRRPDHFGPGRSFTLDAAGLRPSRVPGAAGVREGFPIIFLGDSSTLGFGVGDHECFPAVIADREPRIEALNLGHCRHGADQSWLWFQKHGERHGGRVVVLAVTEVSLAAIGASEFKGQPKPWFRLDGNHLVTEGVPVARTGSFDPPGLPDRLALFRSEREVPSPSMAVGALTGVAAGAASLGSTARAIVAGWGKLCRSRGQTPVLAYLPLERTIGREPCEALVWSEQAARAEDLPFVDLSAGFRELPEDEIAVYFAGAAGLLSRLGHRLVAGTLLAELRRLLPEVPR